MKNNYKILLDTLTATYFIRTVAGDVIGGTTLYLLTKPETDFDSRFKAWDMDNQEFIFINGWLIENIGAIHV